MATPVGHSLAGCLALLGGSRGRRSLVPLTLFMANAPDLDFIPGLLVGTPALYHQGITHSLGVAVAVSLLAAVILQRFGVPFAATFRVSFVAYVSHLALDMLGPDARPPVGIPFFWPLSDISILSPATILPGVHHAGRTDASLAEWLTGILALHNVGTIAVEVVLFAPLAWLATRPMLLRCRTQE